MTITDPSPVVLVHGAWHGAWCWATLQAELDRRGIASFAIDRPGCGASVGPLGSLADDVAHLDATLASLGRPVVLVGHSYAGAVVSAIETPPAQVTAAVFVTAFALEVGESIDDIVRAHPSPDRTFADAIVMRDDATSVLDPERAPAALYARCAEPAVGAAVTRLGPHPMATFRERIASSLIGAVPTTYVRCAHDLAVTPAQQDVMASRCDDVVTLEADHSPFLSAVDGLADVLERVARRGAR